MSNHDGLLGNDSYWGSVSKKTKYVIYGLTIFGMSAVVGSLLVLPLFDHRSGMDILGDMLSSKPTDDVLVVGDETNNSPAYHYWYAPENSFGISEMKTPNYDHFWNNVFIPHSAWQLEAWHPVNQEWVSEWQGTNLNEWLNISRIRSDDNGSEKITLNVTNNHPTQDLFFRFTFGIDLRVKEYVNKSSNYEYELVYPANLTENYTVFFNLSLIHI